MSVFIDSGVWIAAYNTRDAHHNAGKKIISAVSEGLLGQVAISDYIFDEIVTYIRKKIGSIASTTVAEKMLNSPHINILRVDESVFNAAFHIFKMYDTLSFTDATVVVLVKNLQIRHLISFDSQFDGIKDVTRLSDLPSDLDAFTSNPRKL